MNDKIENEVNTRCGFVTFIGRPNVGKSTLMNRLVETKVSIISTKPHTTRHSIMGVKTEGDTQIVFVDTPGIDFFQKKALARHLTRVALQSLEGIDVAVMVIDVLRWNQEDERVLKQLGKAQVPVILVANKIDKVKDKATLLPILEKFEKLFSFHAIIPISALKGDQIDVLIKEIQSFMPSSPFYFPVGQVTNRDEAFLVTEFVREQLMETLGQELPYALTVTLDALEPEENIIRTAATIWVEKDSQKPIVIGKQGHRLKAIGTKARQALEARLGKKVYLVLWVKVREGWADDERQLKLFGYE